MLRILGRMSSINVRKVLWTCDEIGLAYDREDWGNGYRPTGTPDFLALNPNGQVPVIQDEEGVLWESNAICRYLAGRHGRADLLPPGGRDRALVEQWMDWQASDLNVAWRHAFLGLVRLNPRFQDARMIEQSIEEWNRAMGILEGQLTATGAYAAGSAFTLADIVLGLSVHRWRMSPIPRPSSPALDAYYARLKERPAFQVHGSDSIP
ncbi:glutathione S-transferase family protein [Aureimonas populi]|uniref:Glutathione S-transferase family protein n=1 Tax=Aureimonas populi TaxID=1701758 RepID=A0ABW5CN69_9HYPH|nr:glutathione S-transferase family protein [Aureimonas populi]